MGRIKKQAEAHEARILDLKKASSSDQSEIKDLKLKLRLVEQERDKLSGKQVDAAGLRRALTSAESKQRGELQEKEKRISELQRSLATERQKVAAADEKLHALSSNMNKEIRSTKAQEQDLRLQVAEKEKALCASNELRMANAAEKDTYISQLRTTLEVVTTQYGALAASSVAKADYDAVESEYRLLSLENCRLKRKLLNAEDQVKELALFARGLQSSYQILEEQLEDVTNALECLSVPECEDNSSVTDADLDLSNSYAEETRITNDILSTLLSLLSDTQEIAGLHSRKMLSCLRVTERELCDHENEIIERNEKLNNSEEKISNLVAMIDVAKKDNVKLSQEISQKALGITYLERQLRERETTLKECERRSQNDLLKRDEMLSREREVTSRLQATVQRQMMAEEGLRAEIDQYVAINALKSRFLIIPK